MDRTAKPPTESGTLGGVEVQRVVRALPWWRKDRYGWPIETYIGKPVKSAIRILCQNIRKITG